MVPNRRCADHLEQYTEPAANTPAHGPGLILAGRSGSPSFFALLDDEDDVPSAAVYRFDLTVLSSSPTQ
jgi:hypothetical protein